MGLDQRFLPRASGFCLDLVKVGEAGPIEWSHQACVSPGVSSRCDASVGRWLVVSVVAVVGVVGAVVVGVVVVVVVGGGSNVVVGGASGGVSIAGVAVITVCCSGML